MTKLDIQSRDLNLEHYLTQALVFLCCLMAFPSIFASPVEDMIVSRQQTLVIGKVSHNPRKHYASLKPMVDYAAKRLNDVGIKQGKVLLAKDNEQLIHYLKTGQIDWVTETVYSAMIYRDLAQAEFLVRKWKKGVPEFHSVFITRKDSGINTIDQLVGKKIALEDRGSTTAYFLPMLAIMDSGLKPQVLPYARAEVGEGATGYVFAGKEINISTWVHKRIVDVGAYSNLDWDNEDNTPLAFKKDLHIIHRTQAIPRALELVRGDLPDRIKQGLKSVLLSAHSDLEGKGVLMRYQKTSQFDTLTPNLMQSLSDVEESFLRFQGSLLQ